MLRAMIDDEQASKHILSLNEAWQAGRFDLLDRFFHPDVVLLPPDAGAPIVGRAAVVASYLEFAKAATLNEFVVSSLDVYPFDGATVCHMRFEIDYQINTGHFRESGLEIYVVTDSPADSRADSTSDATQPTIVWRSQNVLDTTEVIPKRPGHRLD
jgi:hypothetical protein